MAKNDVSYLYSDEGFTSASSNEEELPKKVSNVVDYRPNRTRIYRKTTSTLPIGHRSKHIILFRDEALLYFKRRERIRLASRRLREKRQLIEENLHKRIKQLKVEQLYLENDLKQRQAYKQNLETELNNNCCMNSLTELLLTDKEKPPLSFDQYSVDFEHFSTSIPTIFNQNNDIDDYLDS